MESTNELEEFCRLCGSEEGIKVSIFEPGTDHVKKIHKVLPISVNEHDSLPKTMCHRCSFKVNDFYEFRINCIRAQDKLKSKLPWLKHKTNRTCSGDIDLPPMVELPLTPINFISPSEKRATNEPEFIDENDPCIVIDDDSPFEEAKSTSIHQEHVPHEKIIMKIKRSDLKKKPKPKSVWETKKRRKRTYNSCRITQVFTTTMDEYENIADIENDPLCLTTPETNENKNSNQIILDANNKNEQRKEKDTKDNIKLPSYILVTNIPRVGFVYTCERCGRTFLSPEPASLHSCHVINGEDNGSKNKDQNTSSSTNDFYSCSECNQLFSRQSQLIAHQKKHYEVVASSSDDSVKPFSRRKKIRRKNKIKPQPVKLTFKLSDYPQSENGIIRHSLLSSESDSD